MVVGELDARASQSIWSWWEQARSTRDRLPWRSVRDPWLTLLAETMLAQTQASRVAERFPEMARRFPTPAALAKAPLSKVIASWIGLGYNRRAVALHRAATIIVDHHGGEVPSSLDELLALPGVGPYTARAVLAFAFEHPVGVLDTNIGRVLARAMAGRALRPAEAQQLADRLVPAGRSREWNLAVMDFGHLVCRRRSPRCANCVLADQACRWRDSLRNGEDRPDPALGSAAVSATQARFAGSDRQGRGRLVAAAVDGPFGCSELAERAGWPDDPARAFAVADGLVREGLFERDPDGRFRLAELG